MLYGDANKFEEAFISSFKSCGLKKIEFDDYLELCIANEAFGWAIWSEDRCPEVFRTDLYKTEYAELISGDDLFFSIKYTFDIFQTLDESQMQNVSQTIEKFIADNNGYDVSYSIHSEPKPGEYFKGIFFGHAKK